jgi:hypothetical protein
VKKSPKTHIFVKINTYVGNKYCHGNFGLQLSIFQKMPKVNKRSIGENSPNAKIRPMRKFAQCENSPNVVILLVNTWPSHATEEQKLRVQVQPGVDVMIIIFCDF